VRAAPPSSSAGRATILSRSTREGCLAAAEVLRDDQRALRHAVEVRPLLGAPVSLERVGVSVNAQQRKLGAAAGTYADRACAPERQDQNLGRNVAREHHGPGASQPVPKYRQSGAVSRPQIPVVCI
jgi:hypothetical protein